VLPRLLRNTVNALPQHNHSLLGMLSRLLRNAVDPMFNAVDPMFNAVDAVLHTVDPFPKGRESLIRALPKSRNRLIRVLA